MVSQSKNFIFTKESENEDYNRATTSNQHSTPDTALATN